jgi:hypothetical protein
MITDEKSEVTMTLKTTVALAAGLLLASTSLSLAASSHKRFAPGQEMHRFGSVKGHPGASGYAPGQLMHQHGSVRGHPGASGYAPGHR